MLLEEQRPRGNEKLCVMIYPICLLESSWKGGYTVKTETMKAYLHDTWAVVLLSCQQVKIRNYLITVARAAPM